MQANELATQAMDFASDTMKVQDGLITTESRLKILYQITKLLEVCKPKESIVNQYYFSMNGSDPAGASS